MKIEKRQEEWSIHFMYHKDIIVERCRFCTRRDGQYHSRVGYRVANTGMRTDKTFTCNTCHEEKNIHHRATNKKQCIRCYWNTKPVYSK